VEASRTPSGCHVQALTPGEGQGWPGAGTPAALQALPEDLFLRSLAVEASAFKFGDCGVKTLVPSFFQLRFVLLVIINAIPSSNK
jgi:hypothetical protein